MVGEATRLGLNLTEDVPAGSPRWRAGRGFFEANEATRPAVGGEAASEALGSGRSCHPDPGAHCPNLTGPPSGDPVVDHVAGADLQRPLPPSRR
jgi:hypothetical protein